MKIAALAGALTLALTTASFAQTTGPSGQTDKSKMGNPDAAMAREGSPGAGMTTEPKMGTNKMGGTTGSNMNTSGSANPDAAMAKSGSPGSTTGPSGQTAK